MLQGTAPEEGALQSVRTTRVLVSKATGASQLPPLVFFYVRPIPNTIRPI